MENYDRYQSILAKSNLVATAGEFVPKSLANLQRTGTDQEQSGCDISDLGEFSNFRIQNPRTCNEPDGAAKENCTHYSIRQPTLPETSEIGECSNSSGYFTKTINKKNNPNRERRPYRYNHNNPNRNWKKPALGDNKDFFDDQLNGTDSSQQEVAIQFEKRHFKANQKLKHTDFEVTSRFQSRNNETQHKLDRQQNKYYQNENLSWRQRDKYWKGEHHQKTFSKYKKQGSSCGTTEYQNGVSVNDLRKNDLSKNGNQGGRGEPKLKGLFYENRSGKYRDKQGKKKYCEVAPTGQREQLINMLLHGVLECLVCCESIDQNNAIWSCYNCYHVLHLKCVVRWAKSSKSDFGWRCPACQNVTNEIPDSYYCFCGKIRDPEWNHQDCPHSCGEVCGKTYRKSCPHKCNLLCHPGPCPQCTATVTKSCGCQKTTKTIQCSSSEVVVCNEVCGKELNCLIHTCTKMCHMGECEECDKIVPQDCFCKKSHREVKCTIEAIGCYNFSCGNLCKKTLTCGNHECQLVCHEGECPKCESVPESVKYCPCGRTEVTRLMEKGRISCTDPIPTCDSICGKVLPCGSSVKAHTCKVKCHEGPCPDCTLETMVKCRCGHKIKKVPCQQLISQSGDVLCEKKCTKKRSCGKHKCNQVCCTGVDHECPLPCNRFLQCGLHRCEETCHRGHCKSCLRASFEELSCECGAQVIFPPVPCGSRRPACDRPCTRVHSCDHLPVHSCHSASQCPPCTVLTQKYCHGRHELRRAVPCHQESFSCGLPCGKELGCGRHKCILPCHSGTCLRQDQSCVQPCTVLRPSCGHICGSPCHEGPCPTDVPCKEVVRVTCECGHRFTTRGCHENAKEFHRIATAKLATKMADLQAGQSIDLNVFSANKKLSYKTLECNDECKLIERNRRLAIALQIRNPDLSAKLTPRYSEYLKNWAKRDPRFCQMIHDKLTDLVQLAKQSKQKSRSYSFDPMNREKRHFIHEYCDHFGCESVAYDQEPKRNVVATALKDKSWLPSVSIVEFIQKENSPRKVPAPVTTKSMVPTVQRGMEVLSSKIVAGVQASDPSDSSPGGGNSGEAQLDYFDWRPQNT